MIRSLRMVPHSAGHSRLQHVILWPQNMTSRMLRLTRITSQISKGGGSIWKVQHESLSTSAPSCTKEKMTMYVIKTFSLLALKCIFRTYQTISITLHLKSSAFHFIMVAPMQLAAYSWMNWATRFLTMLSHWQQQR